MFVKDPSQYVFPNIQVCRNVNGTPFKIWKSKPKLSFIKNVSLLLLFGTANLLTLELLLIFFISESAWGQGVNCLREDTGDFKILYNHYWCYHHFAVHMVWNPHNTDLEPSKSNNCPCNTGLVLKYPQAWLNENSFSGKLNLAEKIFLYVWYSKNNSTKCCNISSSSANIYHCVKLWPLPHIIISLYHPTTGHKPLPNSHFSSSGNGNAWGKTMSDSGIIQTDDDNGDMVVECSPADQRAGVKLHLCSQEQHHTHLHHHLYPLHSQATLSHLRHLYYQNI